MTETTDTTALEEAMKIVDNAIKEISGRDIVSTSEMSDLLLDVRLVLSSVTGQNNE
jgi:hypothetical protein